MASDAGFPASSAFDNDDDAYGGWSITHDAEPGNESWIMAHFTTGAEVIRGYSISALDDNSGNNNKAPADWQLQGSTDGIGWTIIDTRTAQVFASRGETHMYSFNNNVAYNYYRILISQTNLASSSQVSIGEIQLFAQVCLTGAVFQDNGDRLPFYNPINDVPLQGVTVNIVTSPVGNVVATTTTDVSGSYYFSAAQVPATGSFSVIITPPSGKIFVTHPAVLWSSRAVLPSVEEEPPSGAVLFDYHLNETTNALSAVNRWLFPGGTLDFGLMDADPPAIFACVGFPPNMITEADNGHFGNTSYQWEAVHPHQKGFTYSGALYSPINATCTDYVYSNTSATSGPTRGVLILEGRYTVTSFLGTLSDLAYAPYMSQMLNNAVGGWRKSYGTTTADASDQFLAVNGATTGSLPFFKQTGLTLVSGTTYTLGFYGKHANSFAQGATANAQIVIEVLDNGNAVVTSGSLNLDPTTSFTDDRPESSWQLRFFSFTAPGGSGPFTVQLRASTLAAMGNDFYIDDIVLYPCMMGILPLRFVNFTARQMANNDVQLFWEIKNATSAFTEVEYSRDGKHFTSIGNTKQVSSVSKYTFKHQGAGAGVHYYRLKTTDAEKKSTYSAIQKVDIGQRTSDRILLYPNPVTDKFYIETNEVINAIEIIDLSGKSIRKINFSNKSSLQVDVSHIIPGVYFVKLIKKEDVVLRKLIIGK